MGNTTWNAVRTLALVVVAAAAATSCPTPIDDELLLVVADEIEPTIAIDSPAAWSTYGYTVDVVGHLLDSSQEADDGRGFVRTLEFDVSDSTPLDRTVTFERDGSWTVEPADPTFDFALATGDFAFTVSALNLTGTHLFTFTATDLNGNQGDLELIVNEEEGTGPELHLDAGCPTLYSSAVTTSITMQGHVDLTYLEPGTTRYKVVPQTGLPRAETLFTPDALGNFEFTFDPQDTPVLAGMLTVTVWATDTRDNTTEITHSIYDDPHKPAGTFTIASGATYATTSGTSLTFTVTDAISGMGRMRFKNDSLAWNDLDWVAFAAGSLPWTLQATEGTRTVRAQFSDAAGNVLDMSDTIILDTITPSMSTALSIDDGDEYTTAADYTVNLDFAATDGTGSGMYQMRLRNDLDAWGVWQVYASATNMSWELKDADGSRTVSAEFSDNAGNVRAVNDTIILDRFDPDVSAFAINGGSAWTNLRDVTLTITGSDSGSGLDEMRFRNPPLSFGAWQAFSATSGWQLKDEDGASLVVGAEVRDAVDHVTSATDSIGLDRVDPVISSFAINGGAASTTSGVVDLSIAATDDRSGMSEMRFSNDGWTWWPWEPYAATRSGWAINFMMLFDSYVFIEVRDQAGNTTSSSDSIFCSLW